MPFPFTPNKVAQLTNSNIVNVKANLPLLFTSAAKVGMDKSIPAMVGLIATIGVEDHFRPVEEMGGNAYFEKNYQGRTDLGNIHPGDGIKYHGRGFIQITGRFNYEKYGKLLELDLLNHPELALDPLHGSEIAVAYFKDHGCDVWSARGHWLKVRELVNGRKKNAKPNGWDVFSDNVYNLLTEAYAA